MVGATLVPIVEEPDISNVGDFIVWASEERLKVLCGFNELRKPNQSGQVGCSSLDMGTGQSNLVSVGNSSGL
jgi:hypothetical protein